MAGISREEFLEAVQQATARRIPPHTHVTEPVTGEVGRMVESRPLPDVFGEQAEEAGMHVHCVSAAAEASTAIAGILEHEGIDRVMTWATPMMEELDLGEGVAVERWDPAHPDDERKDAAFAMTCGITDVDYAVAETGSLVVCASPAHGRSVSLLGRVHIAVVRAEQIVPDLYDLFPRLQSDFPDGLPSNVTLISGPSKTADIELAIVIGVHGPGVVHIVLVAP